MFKKLFCNHKWCKIGEFKSPIGCGSWKYYCKIYCPFCKREKTVELSRWLEIQKRQEIDEEYEKEEI